MTALKIKFDKTWNDKLDIQTNILNVFTSDFSFRLFDTSKKNRLYLTQKQHAIDEFKKVFEDKLAHRPLNQRIYWKVLDLIDELGGSFGTGEVYWKLCYLKWRMLESNPNLQRVASDREAEFLREKAWREDPYGYRGREGVVVGLTRYNR